MNYCTCGHAEASHRPDASNFKPGAEEGLAGQEHMMSIGNISSARERESSSLASFERGFTYVILKDMQCMLSVCMLHICTQHW